MIRIQTLLVLPSLTTAITLSCPFVAFLFIRLCTLVQQNNVNRALYCIVNGISVVYVRLFMLAWHDINHFLRPYLCHVVKALAGAFLASAT